MGTEAVGGNNTSKSKPRPPHTGVQDHWLEWQVAIVVLFFFFLIFFACKHKWLVLWELNVNLKCLLRTEYGSSSSTTSISMPGTACLGLVLAIGRAQWGPTGWRRSETLSWSCWIPSSRMSSQKMAKPPEITCNSKGKLRLSHVPFSVLLHFSDTRIMIWFKEWYK